MSAVAKRTIDILDGLDEDSQMAVLRFAQFLSAENEADITLYDEAKANDDGTRISSAELRVKYGI